MLHCTHLVQKRCRGRVIATSFFNCCCNRYLHQIWSTVTGFRFAWHECQIHWRVIRPFNIVLKPKSYRGSWLMAAERLQAGASGAANCFKMVRVQLKHCVPLVWPGSVRDTALATCFRHIYNLKPQGVITKARRCELFTNCCIPPRLTFYSVPSR